MVRAAAKRSARTQELATPPASVVARLADLFRRNGYVRWQDEERQTAEGVDVYKKGHEVRMVADSAAELKEIRGLLAKAGFKPARPFIKGRQFRQPVYGIRAVERFLKLVNEATA